MKEQKYDYSNCITVKELIEELKRCKDQNALVYIEADYDYGFMLKDEIHNCIDDGIHSDDVMPNYICLDFDWPHHYPVPIND